MSFIRYAKNDLEFTSISGWSLYYKGRSQNYDSIGCYDCGNSS